MTWFFFICKLLWNKSKLYCLFIGSSMHQNCCHLRQSSKTWSFGLRNARIGHLHRKNQSLLYHSFLPSLDFGTCSSSSWSCILETVHLLHFIDCSMNVSTDAEYLFSFFHSYSKLASSVDIFRLILVCFFPSFVLTFLNCFNQKVSFLSRFDSFWKVKCCLALSAGLAALKSCFLSSKLWFSSLYQSLDY